MTNIDKATVLHDKLQTILAECKINLQQLVFANADKTQADIEDALPVKAQMQLILDKMPRKPNEAGETDDDRMPIDRESDIFKYLRDLINKLTYNRLEGKDAYNTQYYQCADPAGVMRWYAVPKRDEVGFKEFKLPENALTWTCTGNISRPDSGYKFEKNTPKEWRFFHKENRIKMQAACRQAFARLSPKMKDEGSATTANYGEKFAKEHYAKIVSKREQLAKEGFMPCSANVVKNILNVLTVAMALSGTDDERAKIAKSFAK